MEAAALQTARETAVRSAAKLQNINFQAAFQPTNAAVGQTIAAFIAAASRKFAFTAEYTAVDEYTAAALTAAWPSNSLSSQLLVR